MSQTDKWMDRQDVLYQDSEFPHKTIGGIKIFVILFFNKVLLVDLLLKTLCQIVSLIQIKIY